MAAIVIVNQPEPFSFKSFIYGQSKQDLGKTIIGACQMLELM